MLRQPASEHPRVCLSQKEVWVEDASRLRHAAHWASWANTIRMVQERHTEVAGVIVRAVEARHEDQFLHTTLAGSGVCSQDARLRPIRLRTIRSRNWPKSKLAEVEIGRSRNWPKSKLAEVDHPLCSTQLGRVGAWDWRCSTSGGGRTEPTPDRVAGCSVSGR